MAALLSNLAKVDMKGITDIASKATGAIGKAEGVLGQATGAMEQAKGLLGPALGDKNPMAAISGIMGGPADGKSAPAEEKPKGPDIQEKQMEVLQAYKNVILEKRGEIQKQFTEALDRYIKANINDVNQTELKEFIEKTTFEQMNAYFDKINTSYVKHAFVIQIFMKHERVLLKILEQSVTNTNVLANTRDIIEKSSEVFEEFKKQLKEMNTQNKIIRGGNPEVSSDPSKRISEIASWFPDTIGRDTVNADLNYIIQQIFIETMKTDNMLATTINKHMTKDIFPKIIEVMKKVIESQNAEVDTAILCASIEQPDVQNTILRSIQSVLSNSNNTDNAMGVAQKIYNKILEESKENYDKDIEHIFDKKKPVIGGKKTKRKTVRRKKRSRYTRRR